MEQGMDNPVLAVVTGSLTILANPPKTWKPEAEFLKYFSKRKHAWSVRGCQDSGFGLLVG